MKRLLLMAMTTLMFIACTKNGDDPQGPDNGETAYVSLKLSAPATKATNTETPGTASESAMGSATVLLFDINDLCLGSVEFTAGNFAGTPSSDSKAVPAKTKKIFVIVNKLTGKWDLTSANVAGKSWNDLNTYMAVTAADISTASAFLMTNSGTLLNGALQDVTVYNTPADAKAAPVEVLVDRVTSKVIVKTATPIATPAGVTFNLLGWELNTTNQLTSLYSERVTFTSTATVNTGIYRRDNNYLKTDFGAGDDAIIDYIKANYNWLTNGTTQATMSNVARPVYVDDATTPTGVAYCTENTMDADAQLWGHTTKVVVKGEYTPVGITAKTSFFGWKSNYYTVAQLKTEYVKVERADLKADLVKFLIKAFPAGTTYGDLTTIAQAEQINIDAALDNAAGDANSLNEYSGILAKYENVMYYHNAVCYYDALVDHDKSNTTAMALGRYGVVRNNAYELTINSVKGPGTPWIPDPTTPGDPTDPTDPDDEVEANLSVNVKLKQWTLWTQGVDLGK